MNLKSLPGAALVWLRGTRCNCLLVMLLLGLVLRENYPFSNFPMYSSFARRTYYLYLADAKGAPIATKKFGLSSSGLKKIFDRYRRRELKRYEKSEPRRVPLAEAAAGASLLRYLENLSSRNAHERKLLEGLQVQHVRLEQRGDQLRQERRVMAQR